MRTWSNSEKFFWETLRTIVLGILAFIAIVLIVSPFERTATYKTSLDGNLLQVKLYTIENFIGASTIYSESIRDLLSPTDSGRLATSQELNRYQGEAWESYQTSIEVLKIYFPDQLTTYIIESKCYNDLLRVTISTHYNFSARSPAEECRVLN